MVKGKDRQHFESYREQTRVKHSILADYLFAYFHILKRWSNDLVYIDGFAGPGFYTDSSTGNDFDGSPLLALKLIAGREDFSNQVSTIFIEADNLLFDQLKVKVSSFYQQHSSIREPLCLFGTFADQVHAILDKAAGKLAPTFLFVDPCGVSGTSFDAIRAVMQNDKCEAFIFFNIDGVRRIAGLSEPSTALIDLMGSEERAQTLHEKLRQTADVSDREGIIISEYCNALNDKMSIKFIIPFPIEHEEQQKTSHYFIHASKHPLGFRIMKDVMWRRGHGRDEPGGLELRQKSRTNLIPMFDRHSDIKNDILGALKIEPLRVSVFYEEWTMRPTDLQCESSYRQALLALENEKRIEVLDKDGKNVVSVDKRRKIKGKATLAKEYYVRIKA